LHALLFFPPPYKRGLGRPKKVRKKGAEEPKNKGVVSKVGTVIKCSICQKMGHNACTCKNPHVFKTVKFPSEKKEEGHIKNKRQHMHLEMKEAQMQLYQLR